VRRMCVSCSVGQRDRSTAARWWIIYLGDRSPFSTRPQRHGACLGLYPAGVLVCFSPSCSLGFIIVVGPPPTCPLINANEFVYRARRSSSRQLGRSAEALAFDTGSLSLMPSILTKGGPLSWPNIDQIRQPRGVTHRGPFNRFFPNSSSHRPAGECVDGAGRAQPTFEEASRRRRRRLLGLSRHHARKEEGVPLVGLLPT
jgi:hypothetical protein